jgi:quinoprotein glucose dehydrogenase
MVRQETSQSVEIPRVWRMLASVGNDGPVPRKNAGRTTSGLACLLVGLAASGLAARAGRHDGLAVQNDSSFRSVWDGVYTAVQAARGREAYEARCSSCHRADLSGGSARALDGPRFWQDWGEDSLYSLYALTKTTMPRNAATLPDAMYLDIVAYILQMNGYPPGARELSNDNIASVRVLRKEGPGPVPNFALVTVVGCLVRSANGVWSLTNSTEPIRTRNPDPSTAVERERSVSAGLGGQTFELMDVYQAGNGHEGHKMEIKGLLIRGVVDRVNITGIQMLAPDCSR